MIQKQTILKVIDNSGAKTVKCIQILGGYKKKTIKLGSLLVISVQELRNRLKKTSKIKKKNIYKAIILRMKKKTLIKNGIRISFSKNSVALVDNKIEPIGTRIIGPISKKLKKKKNIKNLLI